jgi:broad specificity phosphatase PhoE
MTAEVFLLRHGETRWNAAGRFQGQRDSPLTARGREQAAQLGRALTGALAGQPAVPLHVSPLGRTRDTAAIVRRVAPALGPVTIEHRLQEVSTGAWDGLTRAEIEAGWPGLLNGASHYDWYFRAPDGEPYEAALRRVRAWIDELHGTVVAVSHGLLGRLVRGAWLGLRADEMLTLPVPQDVVWHLSSAGVRPLAEAAEGGGC